MCSAVRFSKERKAAGSRVSYKRQATKKGIESMTLLTKHSDGARCRASSLVLLSLKKNASRAPLGLGCTCSLGLAFGRAPKEFLPSCLCGVRDTSRRSIISRTSSSSSSCHRHHMHRFTNYQSSDRDFSPHFLSIRIHRTLRSGRHASKVEAVLQSPCFSPSKSTSPLMQFSLDSLNITSNFPLPRPPFVIFPFNVKSLETPISSSRATRVTMMIRMSHDP